MEDRTAFQTGLTLETCPLRRPNRVEIEWDKNKHALGKRGLIQYREGDRRMQVRAGAVIIHNSFTL